MTSSTLLADPRSNETIDVFYIKKKKHRDFQWLWLQETDNEWNWFDENLNCQDYFRNTRRHAHHTCMDAPTAARPVTYSLQEHWTYGLYQDCAWLQASSAKWMRPGLTVHRPQAAGQTSRFLAKFETLTPVQLINKKQLYNQQNAIIKYRKHSYMFRLFVYSHFQGISIFKYVYISLLYSFFSCKWPCI